MGGILALAAILCYPDATAIRVGNDIAVGAGFKCADVKVIAGSLIPGVDNAAIALTDIVNTDTVLIA